MYRICFGNFSSLLVICYSNISRRTGPSTKGAGLSGLCPHALACRGQSSNRADAACFPRPSFLRRCSGQWTKSGYTDLADHALIGNMCVPLAPPALARSMLMPLGPISQAYRGIGLDFGNGRPAVPAAL